MVAAHVALAEFSLRVFSFLRFDLFTFREKGRREKEKERTSNV